MKTRPASGSLVGSLECSASLGNAENVWGVCIYIYIYIYTHTHKYVYIYIYVYTHTHTDVQTYRCTDIQTYSWPCRELLLMQISVVKVLESAFKQSTHDFKSFTSLRRKFKYCQAKLSGIICQLDRGPESLASSSRKRSQDLNGLTGSLPRKGHMHNVEQWAWKALNFNARVLQPYFIAVCPDWDYWEIRTKPARVLNMSCNNVLEFVTIKLWSKGQRISNDEELLYYDNEQLTYTLSG